MIVLITHEESQTVIKQQMFDYKIYKNERA
jgi:hypothetical protein